MLVMVSPDTVTVALHRVSVPPEGQFVPSVADVMVLVSVPFPGSGFFTVTENVIVAVAPAARLPDQLRVGDVNDTVPAVAAASAPYVASSSTPASDSLNAAPGNDVWPEL